MDKKTVNAKEILVDIKSGMTNAGLMEKYHLSEKGLQSLFKKLVDAGLLKRKQAEEINEQKKQAGSHSSGRKVFQETLGRIYKAAVPALDRVKTVLRKHPFAALGCAIGAVLILFVFMRGTDGIKPQEMGKTNHLSGQSKSQVETTPLSSQIITQLMREFESPVQFQDIRIIEVAEGTPTPVMRGNENPKKIYCACVSARILHPSFEDKPFREQLFSPALIHLLIKEAQSGKISLYNAPSVSPDFSGGRYSPSEWDDICPFSVSKHLETVRPLWEKREQRLLAIAKAIKGNDLEKLRELKSEGVDLNMEWGRGLVTPLWLACSTGNIGVARFLLEEGADPNERADTKFLSTKVFGRSPLSLAAARGDLNMAAVLIDHGATVGPEEEWAANFNRHHEMEEFLKTHDLLRKTEKKGK